MKRLTALLMSFVMIISLSMTALASGNDNGTDLINYVQTHVITSREEFLSYVGDEELAYEYSDCEEVDFSITVDQENGLIILDTLYEGAGDPNRGTKSGTASRDVYADSGLRIYTIKANGTFSYTTGSCTVTAKSGSFQKPSLSLWTSTPTVSSGNSTPSKAYVKVSGTATCVGFANRHYTLYLYCNSNGVLSSSFSE